MQCWDTWESQVPNSCADGIGLQTRRVCLCESGHRGEASLFPFWYLTFVLLVQDQQDRREGNLGTGTLPIKDLSPVRGQV